jgi:hypothetical protein
MPNSKPDLELRELELKVKELELNVRDLEKPPYKKLSYWTSIITVCIALIGIIGQSYLSNIQNAKANLETEQAKKETQEAKKETQEALIKKENIKHETAIYTDSIMTLTKRKDTLRKNLDKMLIAYNQVVYNEAYHTDSTTNKVTTRNTNAIITKTSNNVSNVLLENSIDILLKSSKLKVYYTTSTKQKAIEIDSILKSKGVQSTYEAPGYNISNGHNEIVYYNEPQLNYCKAVQMLLEKTGKGVFSIRLSSGANTTINHFKIYVVK